MILHLLIGHLNIVVAEDVIWNQVLSIFVQLNAAPLYLCVCANNDNSDVTECIVYMFRAMTL